MPSREVTNTSLCLIKEKIIKTDAVLNIVCEKNAIIKQLQSKLDLANAKCIKKCQELSQLQEQLNSKHKEFYTLSSKFLHLQDQHDQLNFNASYEQTQYNIGNNESYIKIQILEADLIKLNLKINILKQKNEEVKTVHGSSVESVVAKLQAEHRERIKNLQSDLKQSKKLQNDCLKKLVTSDEKYNELEISFNNYKNDNCTQKKSFEKCSSCASTGANLIFKKSSAVFADNSSQTTDIEKPLELDIFSSPEKMFVRGIDVDEKAVRIRQLKTELHHLKNEMMKIVNEKRVLQTNLKCLQDENMKFLYENERLKLIKTAVTLENQLKYSSMESQTVITSAHFADKDVTNEFRSLDKIFIEDYCVPDAIEEQHLNNINQTVNMTEDLGLNLSSSDSDSEIESESCEEILQEMVKFCEIISPINSPKSSINNGRLSIRNCEKSPQTLAEIDDLDNCDYENAEDCQNSRRTNEVSTQTADYANIDVGCQVKVLTEEKEVQCVLESTNRKSREISRETITQNYIMQKRYKKGSVTLKKALQILKQVNYDVVIKDGQIKYHTKPDKLKTKKTAKALVKDKKSLKSSFEIFRKYSMNMSFENGNLINLESKDLLQIAAFNSMLFTKSIGSLENFGDLKNAMTIANRIKLNAVIINGVICVKNALEKSQLIGNEIKEIIALRNANLQKHNKLWTVLDEEENLKGFAEQGQIAGTKNLSKHDHPVLNKRKLSLKKRISRIRCANDLRNKFGLEVNENEARKRKLLGEVELEIKKPKLNYTLSLSDSKDDVSVVTKIPIEIVNVNINGVFCVKKAIEKSKLIDNEIKEMIAIRNVNLQEHNKLRTVLDEEENLKGFAEQMKIIAGTKNLSKHDHPVLNKRNLSKQIIIKERLNRIRRANDLRNKFRLEMNENEARKRTLCGEIELQIKKPKLNYSLSLSDSKDNVSIVTEIPIEIVNLNVNGVFCVKKAIEKRKLIDNEIKEIIAIRSANLQEYNKLGTVLDEEENLRGFAEQVQIAGTKNLSKHNYPVLNKRKLLLKRRISRIRCANDLRNKFELEMNENEARKQTFLDQLEIKKPKLSYSSTLRDNKDNVSVDCDSGYTDGSETSEIPIEIEVDNTRILSSAPKRNFKIQLVKDSLSAISNNKARRKITVKDLFGSDVTDSSEDEISFVKKSPVKKKKATVLEKFRKAANTYSRRSHQNIIKETIENDKEKSVHVQERCESPRKVEFEKGFDRSQSVFQENQKNNVIENKIEKLRFKISFKNDRKEMKTLEKVVNCVQKKDKLKRLTSKVLTSETVAADFKVILENKEHLMQRFISDIPIIKPPQKVPEKYAFRKPLRHTLSTRELSSCNAEINTNSINIVEVDRDSKKDILIESTIENSEQDIEDGEINEESDTQGENDPNDNSDDTEEEEEFNGNSDYEAVKLFSKLIEYSCEESVVQEVYDKMSEISCQHISSIIVYALYKYRSQEQEPSHTPFAPNLSPAYKTIIGFASRLLTHGKQQQHENIFSLILDQLETEFLLHNNNNNAITKYKKKRVRILSLEPLFRFYVSVCMLKAEVLRLRRFLCDMAYYQRDGWYGLLFSVFTIWPAVLPKKLDEDEKPSLKEHDALLMKVLMFFVYKKRNSEEYMYYRPFLTTFTFGYYKYEADSLHIKIIFDELIEKFSTTESDVLACAITILIQRITNTEFLDLLRSESFNNIFKAPDAEKLHAKAKLLWLLDRIIPEIRFRGDRKTITTLENILEHLQSSVQNVKVKNFIQTCIGNLTK